MKTYKFPTPQQYSELCQRAELNQDTLKANVEAILNEVKLNGDDAIRFFTKKFDGLTINDLLINEKDIKQAEALVSDELKSAIQLAKKNIETFHLSQQLNEEEIETTPGVKCWRMSVGIEKVGLYIPGGTAPLFSTILMLGVPAKIAGCQEIVLCTPPDKKGKINPVILYTAQLVGITKIIKAGGAQAIAGMAYGTQSITKVDKIFGPGNQFVTLAKSMIQQTGVAIDMPAGPSEVLVIANDSSNPTFVAADLLSQAEHGTDSQVILVSDSESIIEKVLSEVNIQLNELPRKEFAQKALNHSKAILVNNLDEGILFSNAYAPEHLILAFDGAESYLNQIKNAGSVFLGPYSCESAGDYASGTNHTLPTNGFARAYSGVSLDSFVKKITVQNLSANGIQNIGPSIELMAEAEGLEAHKNAVTVRLNALKS